MICLFATTLNANAMVRIENEDYLSIGFKIEGRITQNDAEAFQALIKGKENKSLSVLLDSRGGDASAAMKIGRLVHKNKGWTRIRDAKCYSACALIFIAGIIRENFGGELGLHCPYFSYMSQSRKTLEKRHMPLFLFKRYVAEMDITDDFYQKMVNTDPSQLVICRDAELRKLVPEYDPSFEKASIASLAYSYGITTDEMRERRQDAKRCPNWPKEKSNVCKEAIYWGLSERAYIHRFKVAKKVCWYDNKHRFSEEHGATLLKTSIKNRLDLPFYARWQGCVINIMHALLTPQIPPRQIHCTFIGNRLECTHGS